MKKNKVEIDEAMIVEETPEPEETDPIVKVPLKDIEALYAEFGNGNRVAVRAIIDQIWAMAEEQRHNA
uniref:Uncharacterized protein n=1 Tax=viral metagenome TaxID=1070528 RepID=A0A6M3IXB9_9ZZZZ